MTNFFLYSSITLLIVMALFLVLLVLIQKGRGGGLASAFGGAGGNTAFGSKTGDVLTWTTSVSFGLFLVLAITVNLLASAKHRAKTAIPTSPAQNSAAAQTGEGTPSRIPTGAATPLPPQNDVPVSSIPASTPPSTPPSTQPGK